MSSVVLSTARADSTCVSSSTPRVSSPSEMQSEVPSEMQSSPRVSSPSEMPSEGDAYLRIELLQSEMPSEMQSEGDAYLCIELLQTLKQLTSVHLGVAGQRRPEQRHPPEAQLRPRRTVQGAQRGAPGQ